MRTALDAMGGDFAPVEIVKGAVEALPLLPDEDEIILVGRQDCILQQLNDLGGPFPRISIRHAEDVIGMNEHPVEALRRKNDSSIARMVALMASGEVEAVVSAGNTGAVAAATQMGAGLLDGVRRPGISVVVPTMYGPVALCDVGANIKCKPIHLAQYGVMNSIYAQLVLGVKSPRVGLLNIGEEEAKGTDLVHETRRLMKAAPINFVGHAEGRDVFSGKFDVIVCDGFVGNVLLKVVEAMGEAVFKMIATELAAEDPELTNKMQPILKRVSAKHDYAEYGGAPLLGVDGICLISHGSSKARAIRNALTTASRISKHKTNQAIAEALAPRRGEVHT